jgi:hypothetical protein
MQLGAHAILVRGIRKTSCASHLGKVVVINPNRPPFPRDTDDGRPCDFIQRRPQVSINENSALTQSPQLFRLPAQMLGNINPLFSRFDFHNLNIAPTVLWSQADISLIRFGFSCPRIRSVPDDRGSMFAFVFSRFRAGFRIGAALQIGAKKKRLFRTRTERTNARFGFSKRPPSKPGHGVRVTAKS